jgi:hypothetical protein
MASAGTVGEESRRRKLDAALDLALIHTFPASDAIAIGSITANEPPRRPPDRKAPILPREERAAA